MCQQTSYGFLLTPLVLIFGVNNNSLGDKGFTVFTVILCKGFIL